MEMKFSAESWETKWRDGGERVTGKDVHGDSAKETAELSSVVALLGVTGHCFVPLTSGQCDNVWPCSEPGTKVLAKLQFPSCENVAGKFRQKW